ncbi:MAG: tripartite tricarboxylate transporter TctB family protein [Rhodobacteraceae bacterium]|nr:tripartite tricarboxylate transporter TctB family protein [Paracoccaceae bacterium]
MSDRIFGGIGLLIAAIFIWQATVIQESFISDAVGPKTFPIIIAIVLGLASTYCIIRPDQDPVWPKAAAMLELFVAVVVMVTYAELLPVLGFAICTAIAAAYLSWRLGAPALNALIAGVLTSAGLYLIFRIILGLSLARGPLGF